ncbi:MAG: LPS assembly protein LptD [Gammaproteobacteria bacterium]|nr:LPS assembly protein LptD [Gammaproteobacteria bacterium]
MLLFSYRPSRLLLNAACLWALTGVASAAEFCPAPELAPADDVSKELQANAEDGELAVLADRATLGNDGVTLLEGNVAMTRADGVLRANELQYDEAKQQVRAKQDVSFSSGGLSVKSTAASVDLANNNAQFQEAEFQVAGEGARGSASQIDIAGDGTPDMRGVRYTTCPPGNESWVLKADRIRLDQSTGQGKANNVSLRFKGVPLFYFPYLQFPFTDQRQSGLLAPSFGSSDNNGVEFGIPYYWNIAPNMDATITPSYLSRRGWRADTEYRVLTGTPQSERSSQRWWQADAITNISWLPNDRIRGEARHLINLESNAVGRGTNHYWEWRNELVDVNDREWFDDFGSSLADVSQPFYVSRSSAVWHIGEQRNHVEWRIVAEDHEPLTTTATTLISRQPELYLSAQRQLGNTPFSIGLKSQAGRFGTQASDTTTLRSHYEPWLGFDLNKSGWWFRSRAALLDTHWNTQTPGAADVKTDRRLPVYNAELGLHLEKAYDTGHHAIEPVVAFRDAPFRDQSNVPVLDTHSETLYWHNLDDDQFSGLDRIRDGQQLSATLASRWYDLNGKQKLGLRLGQLWYLDETQVTLPGEAAADERSNTLFELTAAIGKRWSLSTSGEWNSEQRHIEHSQIRVDLSDATLGDFYVSLRHRRDLFRQASIGGKRQLSSQWHADVSGLYSLDEEELLEANLKLRYQTCCWAVDFGGRRVLRDVSREPDVGFFIQLELTGLAQIGTK